MFIRRRHQALAVLAPKTHDLRRQRPYQTGSTEIFPASFDLNEARIEAIEPQGIRLNHRYLIT